MEPPKPPFPRPNPELLLWRNRMTLCIAAACIGDDKAPHIVLCSDHKIENWAAQAEIGFKYRWATVGWPALIAGDLARAEELTMTVRNILMSVKLSQTNVFDVLKGAGASFREKLADELVRKKLSVSYEYLRQNKGKFPSGTVYEVYTEIGQIDSEAELITAGFLDGKPYLFVIERNCEVFYREHFAAIGSGAQIAEPSLFQRGQRNTASIADTIYQVFEAKKLGEIADAVGEKTTMVVISPQEDEEVVSIQYVTPSGFAFLEQKYKELGLKPVPTLKLPAGTIAGP